MRWVIGKAELIERAGNTHDEAYASYCRGVNGPNGVDGVRFREYLGVRMVDALEPKIRRRALDEAANLLEELAAEYPDKKLLAILRQTIQALGDK